MTYPETLDYLFTRLPMFSKQGISAYKKDLDNTIKLCNALDNPQHKIKTIHVGGTNGKGSTSHMLAAILQTAGYKTGLYTSPHLKDFRERIKINGEMVSEDYVVDFTERITPLIDEIQPSFFEITVVMALDYFVKEKVDIAIIEVGLGGRLDSTNIINPELCIITNIGWDHMNLLGNTIEQIAYEKAGIIKHNTPVVIGESTKITHPIFEKTASDLKADIVFVHQQKWIADYEFTNHLLSVSVANHHNDEHKNYLLDLPGLYQLKNLPAILEAVHILLGKGWKISEQHIKSALANVKKLTGLYGRWEVIHHHPTIVLDVGHNEDGIKQIVKQIEVTEHNSLHIVVGLVKDKEIEKVLSLLPKHATYYFTKASIERALPEETLKEAGEKIGLKGNSYSTVQSALQSAIAHSNQKDLIVVCGSVFVVGEVEKEHLHFSKRK
ncbi:MAG TPA: folylpolyglutamate synthase/dihydrofolate synthase family protein [Segetibacter sp.]|jgi:dihydrofolate synthase/folylpolyglutamate synthase